MRRTHFTGSLMAVLLLSACAPNTQSDAQSDAPGAIAETPVSAPAAPGTDTPSLNLAEDPKQDADLPERYQGLSPMEITRAEIDELILLEAELSEASKLSRAALNAWLEQDAARRGPRPEIAPSTFPPEDKARLSALKAKLQNAEIRKKYETLDSNILSKAEIQEIITLAQKQAKRMADHQNAIQIWSAQDPATRGPQPQMDMEMMLGGDPRLLELRGKLESAASIERMNNRVEEMSAKYNISLSDTEMSELAELETEQQKFRVEFTQAMMAAQKESQLTGVTVSQEDLINNVPNNLIRRAIVMETRKQEIMAPLEAAINADKVQTQLAELSEASGVPILSGEISESIALSAEKDKIKNRTQTEAIRKWLAEGGPLPLGETLPNDEDYARMKEIEARLKEISAPMTDARNAALEANDPALRQRRLKKEADEKWRSDWRDRQQSGEVPPGTRMTSPSYAELQDRSANYKAKLKSRAETVGYAVPDADIERLEALNADMLAIRKKVYDMEVSGTSTVKTKAFAKIPASGLTSGMYKIQLIEEKQREILAGLRESENIHNGVTAKGSAHTADQQFRVDDLSGSRNYTGIEAMIQRARVVGTPISDADAEDLRAFAQELANK